MTREEIKEHAILDLMEYKGFDRLPSELIIDCVFKSINPSVAIKADFTVKYSVPIQAGTELVLVKPLIKKGKG